jgi:5'-3' exonuclease
MIDHTQVAYSPHTGRFYWAVGVKKGEEAGYYRPDGYCRIQIGTVSEYAHRLAFLCMGQGLPDTVDHLDGDPSNNKWNNLRAVNQSVNLTNKVISMLLIDADSLIYAAGFGNQVTLVHCLGETFEGVKPAREYLSSQGIEDKEEQDAQIEKEVQAAPVSHAVTSFNQMLDKQIQEAKQALGWDAAFCKVYLTGKGNFRDKLYSEYKANRKDTPKPVHYEELRRYAIEHRDAYVVEGMEADDMVSYLLHQDPVNRCIVGIDKDLWNTAGWHWNPKKQELDNVTEEQAISAFLGQLLEGDRTDNIPGLPVCTKAIQERYDLPAQSLKGCGKATAQKILQRLDGTAFEKYKQIEELYAEVAAETDTEVLPCLTNAQLLWMTRALHADSRPVIFTPELLQ